MTRSHTRMSARSVIGWENMEGSVVCHIGVDISSPGYVVAWDEEAIRWEYLSGFDLHPAYVMFGLLIATCSLALSFFQLEFQVLLRLLVGTISCFLHSSLLLPS